MKIREEVKITDTLEEIFNKGNKIISNMENMRLKGLFRIKLDRNNKAYLEFKIKNA